MLLFLPLLLVYVYYDYYLFFIEISIMINIIILFCYFRSLHMYSRHTQTHIVYFFFRVLYLENYKIVLIF